MAFIRLSDSYIDHPKFLALSASAFRLWHEGMAFCRKHQTDGAISSPALEGFRYFQQVRVKELTTIVLGEGGPLWEVVTGGYQVRNYLKWNLSRDEDQKQKDGAKGRTDRWRRKRFSDVVETPVTNAERDASQDAHVPSKVRSESTTTKNDPRTPRALLVEPTLEQRAVKLLEIYGELYTKHRSGARLPIGVTPMQLQDACTLCATWDDGRLFKLAEIFLTTNEDWISQQARTFKLFTSRASWCDEMLTQYEKKQRRA